MTPQVQTRRHDPVNDSTGDCLRACIASILDFPIEVTPDFTDAMQPFTAPWQLRLDAWLAGWGAVSLNVPFAGELDKVLDFAGSRMAKCHWLLSGRVEAGYIHTVVCLGNKIKHDPALVPSPLEGPGDDGYWWATYIGKLLP